MNKNSSVFKTYIHFICSVYKSNKLFVISKVFISILSGLLTVITAVVPKYMADSILIDHSKYGFVAYVLLYVGAQLIISAVYSFIELYINKSLVIVNAKCTEDILEKLHRMAYANYEQPESRNCVERAFQFATQTGVSSFNTFISLIGTFITFVSYVYIIAKHNWITLVLLTVSIMVTYILQKRKAEYEYSLKRNLTADERKIGYYKSALLDRFLAKDIRYAGAFTLLKQCYYNETRNYSKKLFKKNKKILLFNQAVSFIQLCVIFAVMVSFGDKLFSGSMTYGDYTMSVNVSMSFTTLIFQLITYITAIYTAILESGNYAEFLKITSNNSNITAPAMPDIVFHDVSFKYGTEDRVALNNFSYTFEFGKKYALIGENGSGKSTILKLLLGMYTPNSGNITIGNVNIEELDPEQLYSLYSVVFQDFRLIDGITLEDNITVGKKMTDDTEMFNLLNSVGLKERLCNDDMNNPLLREYSRTFDSDGIELSGGEKQKMAIARALMKNSPILIFDEPTSAFDKCSEEQLFNVELKSSNKTIIFATHNLELCSFADEVLTMKNGNLQDVKFNND